MTVALTQHAICLGLLASVLFCSCYIACCKGDTPVDSARRRVMFEYCLLQFRVSSPYGRGVLNACEKMRNFVCEGARMGGGWILNRMSGDWFAVQRGVKVGIVADWGRRTAEMGRCWRMGEFVVGWSSVVR